MFSLFDNYLFEFYVGFDQTTLVGRCFCLSDYLQFKSKWTGPYCKDDDRII